MFSCSKQNQRKAPKPQARGLHQQFCESASDAGREVPCPHREEDYDFFGKLPPEAQIHGHHLLVLERPPPPPTALHHPPLCWEPLSWESSHLQAAPPLPSAPRLGGRGFCCPSFP